MKGRRPWELPGPETRRECPGLAQALELLHRGQRRQPTEDDVPPPSLFPMTPAAREALRLDRAKRRA